MNGVFCLEGFWYGDHRDPTSVHPVLELIHRYQKMPFCYHRCGTLEEFKYSLERWKTKTFHKKYPLLYLAFHGEKGCIKIGKHDVTLDMLAEILEDKCSGVVIYFGSCTTLKTDRRVLQRFMERTETLAVLGYKQEVDWLSSTAFEMRLLEHLLKEQFDSKGIQKIHQSIKSDCKGQMKDFEFRMEVNERVWFPRTRKRKLELVS